MVLTQDGPNIIELAARIGGDNIMKLVREAMGVYPPETVIDIALRPKIKIPKLQQKGAAIRFITAKPGIVRKIEGYNNIKKIHLL